MSNTMKTIGVRLEQTVTEFVVVTVEVPDDFDLEDRGKTDYLCCIVHDAHDRDGGLGYIRDRYSNVKRGSHTMTLVNPSRQPMYKYLGNFVVKVGDP